MSEVTHWMCRECDLLVEIDELKGVVCERCRIGYPEDQEEDQP